MSEMVTRVARALCALAGGVSLDPWMRNKKESAYVDEHWMDHIPAAQTAIEAMWEPTEPMVLDGLAESDLPFKIGDHKTEDRRIAAIWRGMIGEALK